MLIDKLKNNGTTIDGEQINPVANFYIEEDFYSFRETHRWEGNPEFAQKLPFESFCLMFADGIGIIYKEDEIQAEDSAHSLYGVASCYLYKEMGDKSHGLNIEGWHVGVMDSNLILKNIMKSHKDRLYQMPYSDNEMREAITSLFALHKLLSFLSCKNVTYSQEGPPEKLQKKRRKQGRPPLLSYHVLKLKPTTTRRDYEARNLWTNRVHLCRGHIREYTAERPLFGKYTGRFWIPPHVRGDKKKGVINKDYSLETA